VFDKLWLTIAGALFWQLRFLFDCVDGEVARLQHQESLLGIFLDDLNHILANPTFALALGLHVCMKQWSVLNILVTLVLCSACHWKRGIPRIMTKTLAVKDGIVIHGTYRFNKKSILSWLRAIIVECFKEVGQIFIVPVVITLNYAIEADITRWFLYLYTILFLGYIAVLTLRDGYIVQQEDRRRAAEKIPS
jgi:phosphatidylglycerophosphate synthase